MHVPKILFFDSGMGGLSVLREVVKLNPQCAYYYLFDHECFPYGNKTEDFLQDRVAKLLQDTIKLLQPDLIVIACNTASTTALPRIRSMFSMPIVGVVPAIKPAAKLSKKKCIALLATPGTVKRRYTEFLINEFAYDCKVIKIGTESLVRLAESAMLKLCEIDAHIMNKGKENENEGCDMQSLEEILEPITSLSPDDKPDVVILGCTHFPLLKKQIANVLGPDIALVDSGAAIARRVEQLLLDITFHHHRSCAMSYERDLAFSLLENTGDQLQDADLIDEDRTTVAKSTTKPVVKRKVDPELFGAQVAMYTGKVESDKERELHKIFAYFGFKKTIPLPNI